MPATCILPRLLFIGLFLIAFGCDSSPTDPDPGSGSGPPSGEDEPELAVESIDPEEGPVGTVVTISGNGFGSSPSDIEVLFDGVEATLEQATDAALEVTVPGDLEPGTVTVEVFVDGEDAGAINFTVTEGEPENGENGEEENGDGDNGNGQNGGDVAHMVEGRVVDVAGGSGVDGAMITFSTADDTVFSDSNGDWQIDELPVPSAVNVEHDAREFPVRTRLVLGPSDEVDFEAHMSFDPPTGTRIAYQFREDCSGGTSCDVPFDIWVMESNGSDKERLTDEEGSDQNPTWSPDADRIAFHSDRGSDNGNTIWIMDADGSDMSDTGVEGSSPAWSPVGDEIAYVHDGNIRILEVDSGQTRDVYNAGSQFAGDPAWSPEGSKIVFTLWEGGADQRNIWVMETDGSYATRLSDPDQERATHQPAWKPTGEVILFTSRATAVDRMWIMNPDGSDVRRRNWPDHTQLQPEWSPSGNEIIYTSRSMIPFSDRVRWTTGDPEFDHVWMDRAPDDDAETEFWANSPAWAPK